MRDYTHWEEDKSTQKKLDKLIKVTEKKSELLKELKESKRYQECLYHLVIPNGEYKTQYLLVRIKDKKHLVWGNKTRIKSYCRLRQIDISKIYPDKAINFGTMID